MNWLRIKKRNMSESLVMLIYILPFFFAFFIELLNGPTYIKYMIDISWCVLFLTMSIRWRLLKRIPSKKIIIWISLFLVYCACSYFFNYQSIFYFLWGIRNNFRFYVFFLACIIFLNKDDIEGCMRIIDIAFYVNSIIVIMQFGFMGYRRDYLGGIFGTQHGCNAYLNIFLIIVLAKSLLYYVHKKEMLQNLLIKVALIIMTAAFAELKFFFVEFAVVILLMILIIKFSIRKLIILMGACVGLYLGVQILLIVFPEFESIMTVEGLWESATSEHGYTSAGDMNRLTALSMSSEMFLRTTEEKLFGLGLGNCDYAEAYAFLTSPFYIENGYFHYNWLSTAFMFLETGTVGLCFFIGFYLLIFREVHKREKKGECERVYCHLAKIMAIMCIIIAIYNCSLRMESAYMLYMVMSVPFLNNEMRKGYLID